MKQVPLPGIKFGSRGTLLCQGLNSVKRVPNHTRLYEAPNWVIRGPILCQAPDLITGHPLPRQAVNLVLKGTLARQAPNLVMRGPLPREVPNLVVSYYTRAGLG